MQLAAVALLASPLSLGRVGNGVYVRSATRDTRLTVAKRQYRMRTGGADSGFAVQD